jgi:hypothetical protein
MSVSRVVQTQTTVRGLRWIPRPCFAHNTADSTVTEAGVETGGAVPIDGPGTSGKK